MNQRIVTLVGYFLRTLSLSLTGLLFVIGAVAYWWVTFPPTQRTPDASYYILVVAAFGVGATFFTTLAVASRANEAGHAPWIVRLPSRTEYLTAVLLTALLFAAFLQLLVAGLALFRGPVLSAGEMLSIPPVWIALNVLTAVLALHVTDFASSGWSRVILFGLIAIFLFGQSLNARSSLNTWLIMQLNNVSRGLMGSQSGLILVMPIQNLSGWLQQDGPETLSRFFSLPFWPFQAITDAIVAGSFNTSQALAPAVLLLYATFLILIGADLFARKDLDLTE
jgi:hypothetical protein